jgi:hypothetical protein
MNIIIEKLDLCQDLKGVILTYCYNITGYNVEEIICIEKQKTLLRNIFQNNRIKVELAEWYRLGVSVSWLRGGGVYSPGITLYGGPKQYETNLLLDAHNQNKLFIRT